MRSIAVEPALISDLSNASYLPEVTLGRWPRCSPIWWTLARTLLVP